MPERSCTINWRGLELKEEKLAEVGLGAGKVKSESLDEASELSEVSTNSSLTTAADAEVEIKGERKIVFSCKNWSDMLYNSLKHTKQDPVLVKYNAVFNIYS